jgi:type IV secretion system protein VirD4
MRNLSQFETYDENNWATDEEFAQGLVSHDLSGTVPQSGIPLLAENGTVFVDASDSHTLIYGSTGVKKTRNFCIPSVYTAAMARENLVVSDPKGEIYANTAGYLASCGYQVQVINIREPKRGHGWNPLLLPYRFYKSGDKDRGIEMVADFCEQLKSIVHHSEDSYWENVASDTLFALIMILFECAKDEKSVNMRSLAQLRQRVVLVKDGSSNKATSSRMRTFWDLVDSFPPTSIISYKMSGLRSIRSVDKTFGCVMSEVDTMLNPFLMHDGMLDMLCGAEVEYEQLCKKRTALFLIIPDEKRTFYFLVSVFIKQCYEYLIYFAQQRSDHTLPIRINFLLDEFSNITKIQDMSSMISAARSRNIRFLLIVQSKRQLYSLYGDEADTIRSNCRNWVFLPCREMDLLNEIQQLCGDVYIEGRGYRPLMSTTALQQLKIGREDSQALVLRQQNKPYLSTVKDFSCYPQAKYEQLSLPKSHPVEYSVFSMENYLTRKKEQQENAKQL